MGWVINDKCFIFEWTIPLTRYIFPIRYIYTSEALAYMFFMSLHLTNIQHQPNIPASALSLCVCVCVCLRERHSLSTLSLISVCFLMACRHQFYPVCSGSELGLAAATGEKWNLNSALLTSAQMSKLLSLLHVTQSSVFYKVNPSQTSAHCYAFSYISPLNKKVLRYGQKGPMYIVIM